MAYLSFEGHANCRLKDDLVVWIDPFYEGNPSCRRNWRDLEKPDVVLVTHSHYDHLGQALDILKETGAKLGCVVELAKWFANQGIEKEQILNGNGWNLGGTIKYRDTSFTMYPSCHTTGYGVAVGFVITTGSGFTCYHPGDTSLFTDMRLIGEMHCIDLAFLPIGDVYTMNPEQAGRAAKLLGAQFVIPIHYKTFPSLVQDTQEFKTHLVCFAPHSRLIVLEPGETVVL